MHVRIYTHTCTSYTHTHKKPYFSVFLYTLPGFQAFCHGFYFLCICIAAAEIREVAYAEANKTLAIAESDYEKQVQASYAQAMKKVYRHLNITREDHKLSLMYVHALGEISDILYNLNFDTLTAFSEG